LEIFEFQIPYHRFVEENIEKISKVFEYRSEEYFENKKNLTLYHFSYIEKDVIDLINEKKTIMILFY
jgi:hypothetical protein